MVLLKIIEAVVFGICLALSCFLISDNLAVRLALLVLCLAGAGLVVFKLANGRFVHVAVVIFCAAILFFIPMYLPWLAREIGSRN